MRGHANGPLERNVKFVSEDEVDPLAARTALDVLAELVRVGGIDKELLAVHDSHFLLLDLL